MKKNITLLMLALAMISVQAQDNQNLKNNQTQLYNIAASGNNSSFGGMSVINPETEIEGSVHLFDNWNNYAVIHTTTDQKFSLKNINVNLMRNVFESKIGQDSLFTFNMNNIDKFVINNKEFKSYYNDGENRIFQVVYQDDNLELLKGFKVQLVEGSDNPMLNRKGDKYVQKEAYFVKDGDQINPIKLKSKSIMKMVGNDKDKAEKIVKYVKNQ